MSGSPADVGPIVPARGLGGPSNAAWSGVDPTPSASGPPGIAPASSRFDAPEAGRYERGHVLGTGGMGRVTQVFDRRLGREVALKEVVASDAEHEARLVREAAITARLDHPSIVPVHDAGRTAEGTLFYTMRIVRGRSLATAIADAKTLDQRLGLLRHVRDACEALAFAHRARVVHRDIKPANIMVGELGETQVLDWGLARELDLPDVDARGTAASTDMELTRAGAIVGTPRYMSPEQAAGEPATPRSDVWSLGALLYEVCAARPALDAPSDSVLAAARAGAIRNVLTIEPRTPPELAAIVMRALAPRPADRYADARELAADLGAYLDGRRVGAHSYTTWDLFVRLVRAWRVPLGIGALATLATVTGLAIAFASASAERERAVAALAQADGALARTLAIEAVAQAKDDARPEAEVLAAHSRRLADSPEARGVLMTMGLAPRPTRLIEIPLPEPCREADVAVDLTELVCREDQAISSWRLDLATGAPPAPRWRTPISHASGVTIFAAADLVLTAGNVEPLQALDRSTGARRPVPGSVHYAYAPRASVSGDAVVVSGTAGFAALTTSSVLTVSPCARAEEQAGALDHDARRWAVSCADGGLFIGLVGARDGLRELHTTPLAAPRGPASALAFTADGQHIVLGATDGRIVVYDTATRAVRHELESGMAMVRDIVTSPDGRWAAVLGDRGGVRLLDVASGTWRGRLPAADTRSLRFVAGRDADLVALGATLGVWRLGGGLATAYRVGGGVTSITPSPDGALLAITRGKGVELRRVADGQRVATTELDAVTKGGAFAFDGSTYVATAGLSRQASRWDVAAWAPYERALSFGVALREAVALLDAAGRTHWVAASYGPDLVVWPDGSSEPFVLVRDDNEPIVDLALAPGARHMALLSLGGGIASLDIDSLVLVERIARPAANVIALGADGDTIIIGEREGVSAWSLTAGTLDQVFATHGAAITSVAVDDGRFVAGGDRQGRVFLWARATGELTALFRDHERRVSALAFSPDARWLATGSWDESVRLRSLAPLPDASAAAASALESAWGIRLDTLLSRL